MLQRCKVLVAQFDLSGVNALRQVTAFVCTYTFPLVTMDMCVCACMCQYVYARCSCTKCTCEACGCAQACARVHVCMCARVHVCTCARVHVCTCSRVTCHVCTCAHVHVCMYVGTSTVQMHCARCVCLISCTLMDIGVMLVCVCIIYLCLHQSIHLGIYASTYHVLVNQANHRSYDAHTPTCRSGSGTGPG